VELVHFGPVRLEVVAAGDLAEEGAEEGAAAEDAGGAEHLVDDDKVVDLAVEQGLIVGDRGGEGGLAADVLGEVVVGDDGLAQHLAVEAGDGAGEQFALFGAAVDDADIDVILIGAGADAHEDELAGIVLREVDSEQFGHIAGGELAHFVADVEHEGAKDREAGLGAGDVEAEGVEGVEVELEEVEGEEAAEVGEFFLVGAADGGDELHLGAIVEGALPEVDGLAEAALFEAADEAVVAFIDDVEVLAVVVAEYLGPPPEAGELIVHGFSGYAPPPPLKN